MRIHIKTLTIGAASINIELRRQLKTVLESWRVD